MNQLIDGSHLKIMETFIIFDVISENELDKDKCLNGNGTVGIEKQCAVFQAITGNDGI